MNTELKKAEKAIKKLLGYEVPPKLMCDFIVVYSQGKIDGLELAKKIYRDEK